MRTSHQDGLMTAAETNQRKGTTMKAQMFDGMARELGQVVTRRSMFRLLGGAAAMGTGLAMAAQDESLGKGRSNNKNRSKSSGKGREQVSAQGKGKKVTICYQNQTRLVKKSKLGNYPGATPGTCPVVTGGGTTGGGTTGGNTGGTNGGGTQQPVACTRWILSGGPNQGDKIAVDDDLGVYNLSRGGAGIISEFDRKASLISPVLFDANVGERINIVGYDNGGCRSLSELWLHCLATGASRKVYAGFNGGGCGYGTGTFVNMEFIV
jgi:hypothetical protein